MHLKITYIIFILFSSASFLQANDFYKSQILKPTPFLGIHGEVIQLSDGTVWEVQNSYEYLYSYYPSVIVSLNRGILIVDGKKIQVRPIKASQQRPSQPTAQQNFKNNNSNNGYRSKIESDNDDIIKLRNGAVLEVYNFFGFIGYNKDSLLFKEGNSWKLWIEGKKSYRCEIIKPPSTKPNVYLEKKQIMKVSSDGSFLTDFKGIIYEVNSLNTIDTQLWIPPFDVLMIDKHEIINTSDRSSVIRVQMIK